VLEIPADALRPIDEVQSALIDLDQW
jgi:hypothetical protein